MRFILIFITLLPLCANAIDYYLTGDVNLWSDITERNTTSQTYGRDGEFDGETSYGFTYIYQQDDPDNPYLFFSSIEELESKWKFDPVDGPGPDGETGWYRLDLKAKGAGDLDGNIGRLCGQFKICAGSLRENSIGIGSPTTPDEYFMDMDRYWSHTIKIGESFDECINPGRANFLLDNTAVDNAVIWFRPDIKTLNSSTTQSRIFIEGDPVDMYIYYVGPTPDNNPEPAATHLLLNQQANDFSTTTPFINGTTPDDPIDHSWHLYSGENGEGVDYSPYGDNGITVHFPAVWRKKIPSSLIHRVPSGFLCSVTRADGTFFGRQRIDCHDLWFVERTVNLFFRYANDEFTTDPELRVYNNAWLDRFDSQSIIMPDPWYLSSTYTPMQYIEAGDSRIDSKFADHPWFMTKQPIESLFANGGYAMFATNNGDIYPAAGHRASLEDRNSVAIQGADLYYVVGVSDHRVALLYSHLNGTYTEGLDPIVQINAEFFIDDPDAFNHTELDTRFDDGNEYLFTVTGADGTHVASSGWTNKPFYDWEAGELPSGKYHVIVKVRRGDDVYTASDIYTIHPATR